MAQTIQLNMHPSYFNEAYLPYLLNEERFTVFYGGGGSGKSHFAVQKMIIKALIYPNRRVLVVRKVQNTIRDSIFELFKQIEAKSSTVSLNFLNAKSSPLWIASISQVKSTVVNGDSPRASGEISPIVFTKVLPSTS